MKSRAGHILVVLILSISIAFGQDKVLDEELTRFADLLTVQINQAKLKRVAVVDLTDLNGETPQLGLFIAEETTVNLVAGTNKHFSVVDRANLKKILAEHALSMKGLIQPETAKELGHVSGIDAIVLGTLAPIKDTVHIMAKIISTETAEIVGAGKWQITKTPEIAKMLTVQSDRMVMTNGPTGASVKETNAPTAKIKMTKSFGDFSVELQDLKLAGNQYLATIELRNLSNRQSVYLGLATELGEALWGNLTNTKGDRFRASPAGAFGIVTRKFPHGGRHDEWMEFSTLSEITGGQSTIVTVNFDQSQSRADAVAGKCRIQLEFIQVVPTGKSGRGGAGISTVGPVTARNFIAEMIAD